MNIIQTYKTKDIPDQYKPFVESVKKNNPKWNYIFFSDEDIISFFKYVVPQYYDTFCSLKYKIQQLDFFRYCAVYYFGGIYLDLDIMVNKSFDDIDLCKCTFPLETKKNSDELLIKQNYYYLLGNYAFYSPKNDPFLNIIINNIVKQRITADDLQSAMIDSESKGINRIPTYVYYTTGPVLVTQSYLDYEKNIKIIEPAVWEDGCFGDFGKHYAIGTWKSLSAVITTLLK